MEGCSVCWEVEIMPDGGMTKDQLTSVHGLHLTPLPFFIMFFNLSSFSFCTGSLFFSQLIFTLVKIFL